MEKSVRQKSKSSINGSSFANNTTAQGSAASKPSSRVKNAPGKRPSGSFYGANLNSAQCVEEIKNAFKTSASIDADNRQS